MPASGRSGPQLQLRKFLKPRFATPGWRLRTTGRGSVSPTFGMKLSGGDGVMQRRLLVEKPFRYRFATRLARLTSPVQ
jgi:hypothetical protein